MEGSRSDYPNPQPEGLQLSDSVHAKVTGDPKSRVEKETPQSHQLTCRLRKDINQSDLVISFEWNSKLSTSANCMHLARLAAKMDASAEDQIDVVEKQTLVSMEVERLTRQLEEQKLEMQEQQIEHEKSIQALELTVFALLHENHALRSELKNVAKAASNRPAPRVPRGILARQNPYL